MGEDQNETQRTTFGTIEPPSQGQKPPAKLAGLTAAQAFLRTFRWLYIPVGIAAILFGYLVVLAFGRFIPDMDAKRFITIVSAVFLALGAILQAALASLISTQRLPSRPGPQNIADPADPAKDSQPMDSGWPDLLNLSGWGFVAAGAILAVVVAIYYP
ncbi:hypothetical protein ACTWLI_14845 [Arthrobacter sp. Hor0625]|uniref:hypothetical protein n=1 Tax=Arthrobacter sp. Hor0625 TaxID=3457358 RepID=UPI00403EC03A